MPPVTSPALKPPPCLLVHPLYPPVRLQMVCGEAAVHEDGPTDLSGEDEVVQEIEGGESTAGLSTVCVCLRGCVFVPQR